MNFGYFSTRGVATGCLVNVASGSVTGITPLAPATLRRVTFTAEAPLTVGTQEGLYNPFFVSSYFNLENRSLLFTPIAEAGVFSGYRVEFVP